MSANICVKINGNGGILGPANKSVPNMGMVLGGTDPWLRK